MKEDFFDNFLKILIIYELKKVERNCSNNYFGEKTNIKHERKETTAEHIYSSLKLADYFLMNELEFENLDKLKIYEMLMYHDDIEIETDDICISNEQKRKEKEILEISSLPILIKKYPTKMDQKLSILDAEYRENCSSEAKFVHAIDKMDAIVHELQYISDWSPKGWTEENTRRRFQKSFEHSPIFMKYFEKIIQYLNDKKYFKSVN